MKKKYATSENTLQMRMPTIIKKMLSEQAKANGVSMSRWVQMLIERENARGTK